MRSNIIQEIFDMESSRQPNRICSHQKHGDQNASNEQPDRIFLGIYGILLFVASLLYIPILNYSNEDETPKVSLFNLQA